MHSLKIIIFSIVFFSSFTLMHSPNDFFSQANQFFQRNVKNGKVDYHSIQKSPELLNELVAQIAEFSLNGKSDQIKKAFLINSYNILTIKQVADRYPIKGPMQVNGFFNQITHQVAGEKLTLDQLEKGILFKNYSDSRMHFALVCAANGCPPLANFAFSPENLDQQLNKITTNALNDLSFIRLDQDKSRLYLSQIFEWYRQDFLSDHTSLIHYINQYRKEKVPENYKIRYYDYDWQLNEL